MAWLGSENKITWEPSTSLTQALIDDFENGVVCKEAIATDTRFGSTNHILTVTSSVEEPSVEEPSAKRANIAAIDLTAG